MTVRINWKCRLEDLIVCGITVGIFVAVGLFAFLVYEAAVEGTFWAKWSLAAMGALFALWCIWEWLVQDDFGDRS